MHLQLMWLVIVTCSELLNDNLHLFLSVLLYSFSFAQFVASVYYLSD